MQAHKFKYKFRSYLAGSLVNKMRLSNKNVQLLALTSMVFAGCSTGTVSPKLEAQIHEQPPLETTEMISNESIKTFTMSPELTLDQKERLKNIYLKISAEFTSTKTEIGQTKSLLFKMITDKNSSAKEMNQLKKKIVYLDKKRRSQMFKALDEVQKVVGFGKESEEAYRQFKELEFPGDRSPASERR